MFRVWQSAFCYDFIDGIQSKVYARHSVRCGGRRPRINLIVLPNENIWSIIIDLVCVCERVSAGLQNICTRRATQLTSTMVTKKINSRPDIPINLIDFSVSVSANASVFVSSLVS